MTATASEPRSAEGWNWTTLGDLFEIQQGKALSPSARRGINPCPFLRTANVLWGHLALAEVDEMDFSPEEETRFRLAPGDLLVCEGGEIGRTAIWNGELEGCYYQNHLHRLRRFRPDVDPTFVMYWMQYAFLIGRRYAGRGNETTIANLSKSRLAAFEIPHPPLAEQRAIAHILDAIQRATEQTKQVISAARELKKSLRQHLFTFGSVRVQACDVAETQPSDMGLVPKRWKVLPLDHVATLQRGFDITKDDQTPGAYPVVSSSGSQSTHSEFRVAGPGVVVGRKGSAGSVHYVPSDFWPHDTTLWVKDFHGHSAEFIFRLLEKFDFTPYITGVANPTLNRNHVHPASVGVPDAHEQAEIVHALDAVDRKITTEGQYDAALAALLKVLLRDLMTGRIGADTPIALIR
jgi:type I restriction enzyme, S subunit